MDLLAYTIVEIQYGFTIKNNKEIKWLIKK